MRHLLVYGEKTFRITVEDDDRITFGPWSPPNASQKTYGGESAMRGTLRIYKGRSKDDVKAVFSGVRGYRDVALDYAEEVAKEEGATIWKSDKDGYSREEKVSRTKEWTVPEVPLLDSGDE